MQPCSRRCSWCSAAPHAHVSVGAARCRWRALRSSGRSRRSADFVIAWRRRRPMAPGTVAMARRPHVDARRGGARRSARTLTGFETAASPPLLVAWLVDRVRRRARVPAGAVRREQALRRGAPGRERGLSSAPLAPAGASARGRRRPSERAYSCSCCRRGEIAMALVAAAPLWAGAVVRRRPSRCLAQARTRNGVRVGTPTPGCVVPRQPPLPVRGQLVARCCSRN